MVAENLATVWEALAGALPGHEVVVQGDRRLTWAEWDDRSSRLASSLRAHGVGVDDKVALIAYNSPEFFEVLFAGFKLRAVPVAFNYRFRADELAEVLDGSDAVAVFFHGSLGPQLEPIRAGREQVRLWVEIPDGSERMPWATPYDRLLDAEPVTPIVRSGADTLMQFTGGTTGRPKGVVWRHQDIAATVAFAAYMPLGIDPPATLAGVVEVARARVDAGKVVTYCPAVPLMHGAGLYGSFAYLQVGGRTVLLEGRGFDAAEYCRILQDEQVAVSVIVGDVFAKPVVAELDRAASRGAPYDLSHFVQLNSGGLMLTADSKRGLQRHAPALTILDGLGSSEGGPYGIAVTFPGAQPDETLVFTATPDTVLLDDETGDVIPWGTDRAGLIAFTGRISAGYYGDDALTAQTYREIDGVRYVVPGDYARIAADGRMTLLGRGSTCINTGGEKVFTEEVEEVIRQHPLVADAVVVGVPDDTWGAAITAVVALVDGAALTRDELAEHVKAALAGYKQPRYLVVVDEVRRTAAGKLDYRWARATALDRLGMEA